MDLENFPTRETAKDMMGMISPIYDRSYVAKWIFEVMSLYLGLAQDTVQDIRREAFPETATWSLPYWEQAYGIETNESLSIEVRRRALIRKRNYRRPMNPARIAALVTEICGRKAELVENTAPHTFEILIYPGSSEPELGAIIKTVKEVKQSQKHFQVVFVTPVGLRIRAQPVKQVFPFWMTRPDHKAGTYPHPAWEAKVARVNLDLDSDGVSRPFPYVAAGTRPDVNRVGKLTGMEIDVSPADQNQVFPYVMACTAPDVNMPGQLEVPGVNARITGSNAGIVYKICGARKL